MLWWSYWLLSVLQEIIHRTFLTQFFGNYPFFFANLHTKLRRKAFFTALGCGFDPQAGWHCLYWHFLYVPPVLLWVFAMLLPTIQRLACVQRMHQSKFLLRMNVKVYVFVLAVRPTGLTCNPPKTHSGTQPAIEAEDEKIIHSFSLLTNTDM